MLGISRPSNLRLRIALSCEAQAEALEYRMHDCVALVVKKAHVSGL